MDVFRKIIFLSTIIFFLTVSVCLSNPNVINIDGKMSNGSTITIEGEQFGVKYSEGSPILFENFENADAGKSLSSALSYWSDRSGEDQDFFISNDSNQRNSFSTNNIIAEVSNYSREAWINDIGFDKTGKAYINYWVRMNFGTGTAEYYQIKGLRLSVGTEQNAATTYPSMALLHWTYKYFPETGGYTQSYFQLYYGQDQGSKRFGYSDRNPFSYVEDSKPVWVNVTMQLDEGSTNTADAEFTYTAQKISEKGLSVIKTEKNSGFICRTSSNYLNSLHIHNYMGTGGNSTTLYYDDVYIDNSWARVEIGDNANYNSCTYREIQIPSAWSKTEISASINQGLFSSGEKAYLFVIDEDGNISDGFPITIGSENSNSETLQAPSGLEIIENCTNGIDDDGDGLIDCNDSDCSSDTACN